MLENVAFTDEELDAYMDAVGRDLFTQDLQETLTQFEQADNFGSLIQPKVKDVAFIRQRIEEQGVFEDLFLHRTNQKVLKVLEQADYLNSGYHVVVANPPYMGSRGMNKELKTYSQARYLAGKSDLFAMFIERNFDLARDTGFIGMLTMQSWMFLSSFMELREKILEQASILSMAHLGARAFDSIGGEVVSTTAFVIGTHQNGALRGIYIRLVNGIDESDKESIFKENMPDNRKEAPPLCFRASTVDFNKIPGSPIAYWASRETISSFSNGDFLGGIASPRAGLATGENPRFQRIWHEVANANIAFDCVSTAESKSRPEKWYPCNSGGRFRKWYGNHEMVVNWQFDGVEIRNFRDPDGKLRSRPQNTQYYFAQGITWTKLSAVFFAARIAKKGFVFDDTGRSAFPSEEENIIPLLSVLCSRPSSLFLGILNSSLSFTSGDIANLPLSQEILDSVDRNAARDLIKDHRADWDAYENSWDFQASPLVLARSKNRDLKSTYIIMRADWGASVTTVQIKEGDNNRILGKSYGLDRELTHRVPISEVTLTCNPHYRYSDTSRKTYSDKERESMLLEDTMKEFISYAVGCMFGRYSLDRPGLILADQGETVEDYQKQVPDPTFSPDEDNVIPILDEGWFTDDIAGRFKQFLRMTFGTENYEENLTFLEDAIGKDISSYFLKSFYSEHVKMYKKRPIYWLFSSPSGSFNALIYIHRYRPDTISIILNDYLRQYYEKLRTHQEQLAQVSVSAGASQGEKTKTLKEIDKVSKVLTKLKEYENEILYPLASKQVEIDLDDGVKVNYSKFGKALKRVSGLSQ